MVHGTMTVDETELIGELLRGECDDKRLRLACGLVFGNPDLADHPDLIRTAALARRAYIRHPLPGPGLTAARLYQFADGLVEVSAEIHGGPSRMLPSFL